MAVIDSGCTKTVCKGKMLTWYLELLPENDKKQVIGIKSDELFGDSEEIKAIKSVEIPARIKGHCTSIKAEVVSKAILLLLSKKAMKDAKVDIDFVNNKIEIFSSDLDIICNTPGHYCIPIFSFKHIDHENKSEVLLSMNDMNSNEEKREVAKKLHKQFGHLMSVKLIGLLKNADIKNKELCVIIEETMKECKVCMKYQKK